MLAIFFLDEAVMTTARSFFRTAAATGCWPPFSTVGPFASDIGGESIRPFTSRGWVKDRHTNARRSHDVRAQRCGKDRFDFPDQLRVESSHSSAGFDIGVIPGKGDFMTTTFWAANEWDSEQFYSNGRRRKR